MRRIALAFDGQPYSVREILTAAKAAETSGFESVWVAEDIWTGRDIISILSCLALSTKHIGLGTCVIGAFSRHPVLIAMTLNTLSDLAEGRLILGIGAGTDWLPLLGTPTPQVRPLRAVSKMVEVVRNLLSGDNVTLGEETVSLTSSFPCFREAIPVKPLNVPVYLGAVGPRMTQLVGEIGDGLILDLGVRREELHFRLEQLAEGASRAQRPLNSIDVAKLILVSVSDNGEIHSNALGFAAGCVSRLDETEIEELGFDPERVRRVKKEFKQGNCQSAGRMLSTDMVSAFIAAGFPSDCLSVIEGFIQAGVDLPILMPFGGDVNAVIELGKEFANRNQ